MSQNRIQVEYEEIEEVAKQLSHLAERAEGILQKLDAPFYDLRQGEWVGFGANAFFNEYEQEIQPALQKLARALYSAEDLSKTIHARMLQTEEEGVRQINAVDAIAPNAGQPAPSGGGGASAAGPAGGSTTGVAMGAPLGADGPSGGGGGGSTGGGNGESLDLSGQDLQDVTPVLHTDDSIPAAGGGGTNGQSLDLSGQDLQDVTPVLHTDDSMPTAGGGGANGESLDLSGQDLQDVTPVLHTDESMPTAGGGGVNGESLDLSGQDLQDVTPVLHTDESIPATGGGGAPQNPELGISEGVLGEDGTLPGFSADQGPGQGVPLSDDFTPFGPASEVFPDDGSAGDVVSGQSELGIQRGEDVLGSLGGPQSMDGDLADSVLYTDDYIPDTSELSHNPDINALEGVYGEDGKLPGFSADQGPGQGVPLSDDFTPFGPASEVFPDGGSAGDAVSGQSELGIQRGEDVLGSLSGPQSMDGDLADSVLYTDDYIPNTSELSHNPDINALEGVYGEDGTLPGFSADQGAGQGVPLSDDFTPFGPASEVFPDRGSTGDVVSGQNELGIQRGEDVLGSLGGPQSMDGDLAGSVLHTSDVSHNPQEGVFVEDGRLPGFSDNPGPGQGVPLSDDFTPFGPASEVFSDGGSAGDVASEHSEIRVQRGEDSSNGLSAPQSMDGDPADSVLYTDDYIPSESEDDAPKDSPS